jgi:hypothetical protein
LFRRCIWFWFPIPRSLEHVRLLRELRVG